jgi:hypothetical protein
MRGKQKGAVSLLKKFVGKDKTSHHCFIHQQVLCSKILQFNHVLSVVVNIVNYFRKNKTKHRIFKQFLKDCETEFGDVVYHTEIRWLSKANVLKHFVSLFDNIVTFLENDSKNHPQLYDQEWKDLYFLFSFLYKYFFIVYILALFLLFL